MPRGSHIFLTHTDDASEKETIPFGKMLKEYEDKVTFFRLLNEYKKTNDKMIFNSLASIAKDYPKTKIFFEICLSIAFRCGLYFSFIDLYEKSEVDLDRSFDIMAIQAYINVGQAEKLISMISQNDLVLELKQEMETIIDKKRQYNRLSTQAFKLFLSEKRQEAFEIQKQACDVYPWGYASILNRLLYYIYKEEQGEIQYAPIRGDEELVYYMLHLIIYYLIINDQDAIQKISVLTPTLYNVLLQVKEETGTIPSRISFYHETGLLEYPIRETANFLKKYGDKRAIRDANYDKIVTLYQREGVKQEIPGDVR